MKKILFTCVICLATVVAMANHWDGPMGIYLKTNTSSDANNAVSRHFRITSDDWGDNGYSAPINNTTQLNGVDLGEITSLKLDGGIYVGGTNDDNYPHHWYDENGFKIQYVVYRQGTETPSWDDCAELALDNKATDEYSNTNRNYVFNATNKDINLIALTNAVEGTYVLRVRMKKVKHYWNQDDSNGTWTEYTDPQETTFSIKNYITGNGNSDSNNSFCGAKAWWAKYDAGLMSSGSRTYSGVAPGTYSFYILTGSWDIQKGYSDLNQEACDANVYEGDDNKVSFKTDATSDITINLDANGKLSVTSTLGRFVRTPYSVVGDPVLLEDGWDATKTQTEMMRQDDGTYRYTVSNIALEAHNGRKFKIVGGHSWSVYQAPAEGDFTVDIPVAGIYDLVFDFDPATNLATCTPLHIQNVTISQYQFNTFYSDKAYTMPEGLTAFIFTGIENEMLVMEEINPVPANTGVVLYGAANQTYALMQTQTDVTYNDNMLHGTLADETINNANIHYVLSLSNAGECGFFWPYNTNQGVGSFTNHAGKAYLEIPGGSSAPKRIRGFILTAPRVATAIEDVNEDESENACYDLLGRKVSQPQQGGVYIMNGKKMIIF